MRNGTGMQVTGAGMEKLMRDLERLARQDLLVGFPEGEARDDGLSNAQLAYIHDNGAPEANIPARPFMAPAIEDVKQQLGDKAGQVARALTQGRDVIDQGMHQMGLIASVAIKDKINSNIPPQLSEMTIASRQARGVTRTNTLVDTGQMRNAATYVIRERK
jgi:hypothetical protein